MSALALAVAVSLAGNPHAADALRVCAEQAIARAPEADRADLARSLAATDAAPDLDALEKRAMAESDREYSLLLVAEDAARANDQPRVERIAKQMAADYAAKPPTYEMDVVRSNAHIARAFALAKRAADARSHFDAAARVKVSDVVTDSAHRELLLAALAMADEPAVERERDAFVAAVKASLAHDTPYHASTDVHVAAREVAYAGHGARALAWKWPELAGAIVAPSMGAPAAQEIADGVRSAILEGAKARHDLALQLALVKAMAPRARIFAVEQMRFSLTQPQQTDAAWRAELTALVALEPQAALDDFARVQLIEVLTEFDMPLAARPIAARIASPFERARGEALAAEALALVDAGAALTLAKAARTRIEANRAKARRDVDNDRMDLDAATSALVAAFARAGALDDARKLGAPRAIDIAYGLRNDATKLRAWSLTLSPKERAWLLVGAVRGWDPAKRVDALRWTELCALP